MRAALGHWSIDNIVQARSAPPVFVLDTNVFRTDGNSAVLRPNLVSGQPRSEEHTSELQSQSNLVCRLLLEKKKKRTSISNSCVNEPLPLRLTQLSSDP